MPKKSDLAIRIGQVVPNGADQAFAFHSEIAASNSHIFPRRSDEFRKYCDEGSLFGAWEVLTGRLLGLCYAVQESDGGKVWEVGGLAVEPSIKKRGIGSTLVRFAVGLTLTQNEILAHEQYIVAHVHEANREPRKVLSDVGFCFLRRVSIPPEQAPATMKPGKDGRIHGDELHLSREGFGELAHWFRAFDGGTGRPGTTVTLEIGTHITPKHIASALDEMMVSFG